jgi:hydroxylamine reductase
LSLALSWRERKARAVLLSLSRLGGENIRLGPSLPAFVRPEPLAALSSRWGLKSISTPEKDLEAMMDGRP